MQTAFSQYVITECMLLAMLQETVVRVSSFMAEELPMSSPEARGKGDIPAILSPGSFPAPVLLTRVFLDVKPGVLGMARRCLQGIQK